MAVLGCQIEIELQKSASFPKKSSSFDKCEKTNAADSLPFPFRSNRNQICWDNRMHGAFSEEDSTTKELF